MKFPGDLQGVAGGGRVSIRGVCHVQGVSRWFYGHGAEVSGGEGLRSGGEKPERGEETVGKRHAERRRMVSFK